MSYEQAYTLIDGAWHAIGWSEHTQCNLVIPFGNGYVTELPDGKKAHCGPDTKITETEAEKPDPEASKAVADELSAQKVGVPVESVTGEAAEEYEQPVETKPATKAAAKVAKGGKVV